MEENFIQENCLWESTEHCISQICLTRGHPKVQDYCSGLIQDPDFLEAWSCPDNCFEFSNSCVKCYFVEKLCSEFQQKFYQILDEPISNVINGLSKFKLLH